MSTERKIGIVFLVLTVLCTALIWNFSFDTAEQSTVESDKVKHIISDTVEHISGTQLEADALSVRKLAHVSEFSVFGLLLFFTLYFFGIRNMGKIFLRGSFLSLCVAGIDESLQLFSQGRSAQFSDVVLDLFGSVLAFSFCIFVARILTKKRNGNVN